MLFCAVAVSWCLVFHFTVEASATAGGVPDGLRPSEVLVWRVPIAIHPTPATNGPLTTLAAGGPTAELAELTVARYFLRSSAKHIVLPAPVAPAH